LFERDTLAYQSVHIAPPRLVCRRFAGNFRNKKDNAVKAFQPPPATP
jgi:hypothetical protein